MSGRNRTRCRRVLRRPICMRGAVRRCLWRAQRRVLRRRMRRVLSRIHRRSCQAGLPSWCRKLPARSAALRRAWWGRIGRFGPRARSPCGGCCVFAVCIWLVMGVCCFKVFLWIIHLVERFCKCFFEIFGIFLKFFIFFG